eukprot:COSAG01_NODE_1395_length_10476_cov_11.562331_2_plen_161_part_00
MLTTDRTALLRSASIMFVAIVIFSVLMEVVIHTMAHATEEKPHYREMVQKVYAELTILGFISFSLTIVREVARESSGGETIEVRRLILPASFPPPIPPPPSAWASRPLVPILHLVGGVPWHYARCCCMVDIFIIFMTLYIYLYDLAARMCGPCVVRPSYW